MNVKIQGSGNGTYANTGSCVAVTNYLQHEDLERMKKGEEVQPFFNQFRDYVSAREVTFKIDNNKAKLSRTDAKFYVITVSPSEKELRCIPTNNGGFSFPRCFGGTFFEKFRKSYYFLTSRQAVVPNHIISFLPYKIWIHYGLFFINHSLLHCFTLSHHPWCTAPVLFLP